MLCFVGLAGITFGIYLAAEHLYSNRGEDISKILQTLVVDIITVLAVLEVIRTILSYLAEGRVRVSLIIDTVMIVTLNEIIKQWFEHSSQSHAVYLALVPAVLMGLRILAIKFGPSKAEKV